MSDAAPPQRSASEAAPPIDPGDDRVREWLRSQQAIHERFEEAIGDQQIRLARRIAWSWLPSAIIIYWMAWILTRYVSFAAAGDIPEYHVEPFGTATEAVALHYDERSAQPQVYIEPDTRTKLIRIDGLTGTEPCRLTTSPFDPGIAMPAGAMTKHVDTISGHAYYDLTPGNQSFAKWNLRCQVDWGGRRDSFTTTSFFVFNSGIHPDALSTLPPSAAQERLAVNATWLEQTGNVKLSSSNALVGTDPQERILRTGNDVLVQYEPANRDEWRDIILICIGALLAIGATIFLEAIRPLMELSMRRSTHREL